MPIAAFLFGYFGVVMCSMMGYAVFQYQGALGFAIAEEGAQEGFPAAEWRRRRALAEAEVRIKEGQSGTALETLTQALQRDPDDLKLNERFHQLLFGLNDRSRCLRHLEHYLPLAARLNAPLGATALLNARQLQADYMPADAQVCERIAGALIDRHKVREGLSLLRNLHQRFPDYPFIPRAYLLAARASPRASGRWNRRASSWAISGRATPALRFWRRWGRWSRRSIGSRPTEWIDRAKCTCRLAGNCNLQVGRVWLV